MRFVAALLVFLAIFEASQCRNLHPKFTQRLSLRTPFYKRQRYDGSPLIVGGSPADIADFPHHLGLLDLSFGGYICGASNIHPLWALSVAHCLEFGVPAQLINLWGGSTHRFLQGHVFAVTDYFLHPQYDTFTLDFDVAVLRVDENTPLTGFPHVTSLNVPPACLQDCCDVCLGEERITVTGWGRTETSQVSDNLLQVQKPIYDHNDCYASWGGDITSRMFCTEVINRMDSCNGDSGSPAVRNGNLVGLVSFGSIVCGDGSVPAVYVRLEDPLIRDFIRFHTSL